MAAPTHDREERPDHETATRPAPSPLPNAAVALALQRTSGNAAVSRLLQRRPETTAPQRDPAASETSETYTVGPNTYRDDQWAFAVNEVVSLWNTEGGVLSKRKEAVAEFCGTGGAGAAASPSIADRIIEATITAVIAAATNGVGTAVGAALGRGVTALARKLPIDPEIVIGGSTKVVDFAVKQGKEAADKRLGDVMKATPTPSPGGATPLATPLATYQRALNETLDADVRGARAGMVQQLLALSGDPAVRWAVAAALYEALSATLEACKRAQWNAVSDGWFSMQVESGAGKNRGYDTGIVVVELNDAYPTGRLRASGAYLGGQGANDATMPAYNDRPLGEIDLPVRIRMEDGSMGHGILDCGWQIWRPAGADTPTGVRHITRWGLPWLAARALRLEDIDTDDERVEANVFAGAQSVWNELKGQSAAQLGTSFSAMSMTSGVGASPF